MFRFLVNKNFLAYIFLNIKSKNKQRWYKQTADKFLSTLALKWEKN